VDRDSQLSPRPTAKTISFGVALAIVASLALVAVAYFGSNADPNPASDQPDRQAAAPTGHVRSLIRMGETATQAIGLN
jgi:hypothetical protein